MFLGGEEEFLRREKGKIMIHITSNSIDILNHLLALDGKKEKITNFWGLAGLSAECGGKILD